MASPDFKKERPEREESQEAAPDRSTPVDNTRSHVRAFSTKLMKGEELTSEQKEQVMALVQDLDTYGIGYHVMLPEHYTRIKDQVNSIQSERNNILTYGILGTPIRKVNPKEWNNALRGSDRERSTYDTEEKKRTERNPYAEHVKVEFHIVGRSTNQGSAKDWADLTGMPMEETIHYKNGNRFSTTEIGRNDYQGLTILFGLDRFKEIAVDDPRIEGKGDYLTTNSVRTYTSLYGPHPQNDFWAKVWIREWEEKHEKGYMEDFLKNHSQEELWQHIAESLPEDKREQFLQAAKRHSHWFLFYRVAPRDFTGIVDPRLASANISDEEKMSLARTDVEYRDQRTRQSKVILIPVYDSEGNIWWPEKMSREEVIALQHKRKEA